MDHPTRRKAGLALAIVATLTAAPAHAIADAPAAGDEYVLEIPGVRQSENAGIGTGGAANGDRAAPEQLGVVGETDPPPRPLGALADAAGAIPGALLAGFAALIALAVAASVLHRRKPNRGR